MRKKNDFSFCRNQLQQNLKVNVISALLTHSLCQATIKKLYETTSRLNVQPGNILKRFSRRRFPCYIKTNSERKFLHHPQKWKLPKKRKLHFTYRSNVNNYRPENGAWHSSPGVLSDLIPSITSTLRPLMYRSFLTLVSLQWWWTIFKILHGFFTVNPSDVLK